jgi:hypothetical protein
MSSGGHLAAIAPMRALNPNCRSDSEVLARKLKVQKQSKMLRSEL